jgi:hypothetical protein
MDTVQIQYTLKDVRDKAFVGTNMALMGGRKVGRWERGKK